MQRAKWTTAQRDEALTLLAAVGKAEAARRTGIPAGTIASWGSRLEVSSPDGTALDAAVAAKRATVAQRKAALAEGLLDDAERLRAQLFAPSIERKPLIVSDGAKEGSHVEIVDVELARPSATDQKAVMVAVAVAVDKVQLLTGEATWRGDLPVGKPAPAEPLTPTAERERALAAVSQLAERRAS